MTGKETRDQDGSSSAGGLRFNIGNLYVEPIINEDCTIMGRSELNFASEDFTLPDM